MLIVIMIGTNGLNMCIA